MLYVNIIFVIILIGSGKVESESDISEKEDKDNGAYNLTDKFVEYTSLHDIVSITVPQNAINFVEGWLNPTLTAYFVEADINKSGQKEYKGLYSLKNRVATKLLETGTDAHAAKSNSTNIYFSATDGIYIFNAVTNKIEKYGNLTDSFISINEATNSDTLYLLTDDHEVFKVTDGGNTKEKLNNYEDVQEIVLDNSDELYFYDINKVPYVVTTAGVQKIIGLPENPEYMHLIRPFGIAIRGAVFLVDGNMYLTNGNTTRKLHTFEVTTKPTAYSVEATVYHYFCHSNKIYKFYAPQTIFEVLQG